MDSGASSQSGARVAGGLTKVPEIALIFWVLKLLTTGMGEAMSDFLGQKSVPLAAFIGIFGSRWLCGCSCARASTGLRTTGLR